MVTQREKENKERTEWIYLREIITLFYKFTRFFIFFPFLSDEGPMLKTLDNTIRIGSTPTNLYFDLYLYSATQHTTFIRNIKMLVYYRYAWK